jgi:hypothetical protein
MWLRGFFDAQTLAAQTLPTSIKFGGGRIRDPSRLARANTQQLRMALTMRSAAASRSGVRAAAPSRRATVCQAKAGNWLPGSAQPAWLPESLPG